jgi:hypothetical protein
MTLQAGDVVTLKCLGANADVDGFHFLDGQTMAGTVGLAPRTGGQFTGTRWKVFSASEGIYSLECEGSAQGKRWLDGLTATSGVQLADQAGSNFTGTRWRVHPLGDSVVQLECKGDLPGPRWLDGITAGGKVRLTSNNQLSGTRWEVIK